MTSPHFCIECGKELIIGSIRKGKCQKCYNKEYNQRHGVGERRREWRSRPHFCIECGKELIIGSIRKGKCRECYGKEYNQRHDVKERRGEYRSRPENRLKDHMYDIIRRSEPDYKKKVWLHQQARNERETSERAAIASKVLYAKLTGTPMPTELLTRRERYTRLPRRRQRALELRRQPDIREITNAKARKRYATDAELRKRNNIRRNERRAKNRALGLPSYEYEYSRREGDRERKNARHRKWRANSINKAKENERQKNYWARPEVRTRRREYDRRPEVRERRNARHRKWRANSIKSQRE